jgi:hypothetical protein
MKTIFLKSFLLVFLLLACNDDYEEESITINCSGTITDFNDGSPIKDAVVSLSYIFGSYREVNTNERGEYSINLRVEHALCKDELGQDNMWFFVFLVVSKKGEYIPQNTRGINKLTCTEDLQYRDFRLKKS